VSREAKRVLPEPMLARPDTLRRGDYSFDNRRSFSQTVAAVPVQRAAS
jgi:hypothetical protein